MTWIPAQLREVAAQVAARKRPATTVRTLLSWFGAQRRGLWIVHRIREALKQLELRTSPNFDWTYLDGQITFVPSEERVELSEEGGCPTGS